MPLDKATAAYWAERNRVEPFNCKANRKWGKEADWIRGEGPYASLSFCPHGCSAKCLTIMLYATLEAVIAVQEKLMCGGRCQDVRSAGNSDWHQIWDLSARGYKRLDKKELGCVDEATALQAKLEKEEAAVRQELLEKKMKEAGTHPIHTAKVLFDVDREVRAMRVVKGE